MPETINDRNLIGGEIQVPTIVGVGSGRGFSFRDLYLPKHWEALTPIRSVSLPAAFKVICQRRNFVPGKVEIDEGTGLLTRLSIDTDPISIIKIQSGHTGQVKGEYFGINVEDIDAAILLHQFVALMLDMLWVGKGYEGIYSYINGEPENYYSVNLKIPAEFLNPPQPLIDSINRYKFKIHASNIAGRFGVDLGNVNFDERGIPVLYQVRDTGGISSYYLSPKGTYLVDSKLDGYKVASLHAIGAYFVNNLLRLKMNSTPKFHYN